MNEQLDALYGLEDSVKQAQDGQFLYLTKWYKFVRRYENKSHTKKSFSRQLGHFAFREKCVCELVGELWWGNRYHSQRSWIHASWKQINRHSWIRIISQTEIANFKISILPTLIASNGFVHLNTHNHFSSLSSLYFLSSFTIKKRNHGCPPYVLLLSFSLPFLEKV
jgi:hypothetical protein